MRGVVYLKEESSRQREQQVRCPEVGPYLVCSVYREDGGVAERYGGGKEAGSGKWGLETLL